MKTSLFVMIKPDGIRRCLIGEIISRFSKRGFDIQAMRLLSPDTEILKKHYAEHAEKYYYDELIRAVSSGPVVAMMLKGDLKIARNIVGSTVPWEAAPGTIRGDYSCSITENLVHCSDSLESAKIELELWFGSS